MERSHTFSTLDGLRGVAAIAVVAFHYQHLFGSSFLLPHAYLAVDFFCMLSGFVLTYAYQKRLDNGWSTGSFMKVRLIRLYPLYLSGLLLGLLFRVLGTHFGKTHLESGRLAEITAAGLTLLPSPVFAVPTEPWSYPLDFPAWTLFFEIIANLFHALVLRRRSFGFVGVILLLTGGVFFYLLHGLGAIDHGINRAESVYALARVLFAYLTGILLFRFWSWKRSKFKITPLLAVVLLISLLAAPVVGRFSLVYDLSLMLVAFPLLLVTSASSEPSLQLASAFRLLGRISYPLYILHAPLGNFFAQIVTWSATHGMRVYPLLQGTGLVVLACLIALVMDRLYDKPLRDWLHRAMNATKLSFSQT